MVVPTIETITFAFRRTIAGVAVPMLEPIARHR
jgi:hypothetical protein